MDDFIRSLKDSGFAGKIDSSAISRELFSHDASLFEIMPKLIVSPKNADEVKMLVQQVAKHKKNYPQLSLTARSAGTDMSGGAINESIIVDFNKYFTSIEAVSAEQAHAQPGVFYRNFEKETLKHGALMPSFPASRELCTIGGMVANNAGGEKSLEYGKTENFVQELKVVLSDGNEYTLKPLDKAELDKKMSQKDFEGEIYGKLFKLLASHNDQIKAAKPRVSKNSTGYNLWDVWDRENEIFDLTKLFVCSQGTLGFVTDIKFKLVPVKPYSGVLVCFMKNFNHLGDIINDVLKHQPATFESFDNYTLNLSIKFFPYFRKTLGWKGLVRLGLQLLPDALILFRGIPKLILLIEFSGATQKENQG